MAVAALHEAGLRTFRRPGPDASIGAVTAKLLEPTKVLPKRRRLERYL